MTVKSAQIIIEKFGGPEVLAKLLKVNVSTVYRWTYPVSRGGTGGTIPHAHQIKLMRISKRKGVDLQPADFFVERRRDAVAQGELRE